MRRIVNNHVIGMIGERLRALALARGIDERQRRRLDQRLDELIERFKTNP